MNAEVTIVSLFLIYRSPFSASWLARFFSILLVMEVMQWKEGL